MAAVTSSTHVPLITLIFLKKKDDNINLKKGRKRVRARAWRFGFHLGSRLPMCNRGGPILGYVNIRSDPPSCASSGLVAVCDSTHTFPSLVVRGGIIKREGLGLAIGSTHLPGPNPEQTLENGAV